MNKKKKQLLAEEHFHDEWAKTIDINNLSVYEAFEGPVSPEYRFAVKLLGDLKGKKILNPGCGAGEESIYLAQQGAKMYGTDLSSGMVEVSKKLAKKFKLQDDIKFEKMDAQNLKYKDGYFDLIFGNSVLHHLGDLNKAAKEFKRVLKKGGKCVFIDPLAYNPFINIYRKMAMGVRTYDEHPLTFDDVEIFKKHFKRVKHYEFQLFTLLIFFHFYLIQRIHPNKARYWKKIIKEGHRYKHAFNILFVIDKVVLKLLPFLRRYCWVIVVEVS